MGFGFKSTSGGDFNQVMRYDARSGRIFRDDRGPDGKIAIDITNTFAAIVDFEQVEVGWMHFAAGSAPDFRMVPIGQDKGLPPSPDHKEGVRIMLKLGKSCGGDVRELATTAKSAISGLEEVYDAYLAEAAQHPGKLPVIKCVETKPITVKSPKQSTTNYQPVFKITGWQDRPADLPLKAAANPAPQQPVASPAAAVQQQEVEEADFG